MVFWNTQDICLWHRNVCTAIKCRINYLQLSNSREYFFRPTFVYNRMWRTMIWWYYTYRPIKYIVLDKTEKQHRPITYRGLYQTDITPQTHFIQRTGQECETPEPPSIQRTVSDWYNTTDHNIQRIGSDCAYTTDYIFTCQLT